MAVPQGDPAALERLAAELDGHASDMEGLASSTARTTADIKTNADWTGSAADAYTGFTTDLTHGVGSVQAPLSKIASSVRSYAGYLRTAQEKVSAYNSAAQTAAATGHPAHVTAAQAAGQDAQSAVVAEKAAGDQAAKEVEESQGELEQIFGKEGLVRKWLEKIHAPWDALAGDAAVGRALAIAGQGEEISREAKEYLENLPKSLRNAEAELEAALDAKGADYETRVEATLQMLDDFNADRKFIKAVGEAGEAMTKGANAWRGVALGSDALGIAGDAYTIWKPEDGGVMGNVDRGVAGVNAAASAADGTYAVLGMVNATTDEFPVVGEVVLIGSGVYLGGDYLYHHWTPFRNVCNDVGHATVAGAKDFAHAVTSTAKDAWHDITSL